MKIKILIKKRKVIISKLFIVKLIKNILKDETFSNIPRNLFISVVISNNRFIQKINKIYRGKDKATDVLSFNLDFNSKKYYILGEIIISYDMLLKYSLTDSTDIKDEFNRILIHSLLHLTGYDHESNNDAIKMREKELSIYKNLYKESINRGDN